MVAAPFVYAADKVRGEPEPGPAVPTLDNAPPPPPPGPAPTEAGSVDDTFDDDMPF